MGSDGPDVCFMACATSIRSRTLKRSSVVASPNFRGIGGYGECGGSTTSSPCLSPCLSSRLLRWCAVRVDGRGESVTTNARDHGRGKFAAILCSTCSCGRRRSHCSASCGALGQSMVYNHVLFACVIQQGSTLQDGQNDRRPTPADIDVAAQVL